MPEKENKLGLNVMLGGKNTPDCPIFFKMNIFFPLQLQRCPSNLCKTALEIQEQVVEKAWDSESDPNSSLGHLQTKWF